jgi:hypothetical protein
MLEGYEKKKGGWGDKTLNKNINISVITESKKKLQGTKQTSNYTVIYSGVTRFTRDQWIAMIWVHKSISNKIDYYKFWSDKII